MEAHFYENEKGELFFFLKKASIADHKAEPFIFDGPATEQHKAHYSRQFAEFLAEKEALELAKKELEELVKEDEPKDDAPALEAPSEGEGKKEELTEV